MYYVGGVWGGGISSHYHHCLQTEQFMSRVFCTTRETTLAFLESSIITHLLYIFQFISETRSLKNNFVIYILNIDEI